MRVLDVHLENGEQRHRQVVLLVIRFRFQGIEHVAVRRDPQAVAALPLGQAGGDLWVCAVVLGHVDEGLFEQQPRAEAVGLVHIRLLKVLDKPIRGLVDARSVQVERERTLLEQYRAPRHAITFSQAL